MLAEYDSLEAAMGAFAALDAAAPEGVIDLVPAARTVLVRVDPRVLPLPAARRWIADTAPAAPAAADTTAVTIPVRYDGPDLADTARLLGLTTAELVERHTAATWTSAFIGFAPGFAYLVATGLDLAVPRRATSRPRVPAGSVALAGAFSGVYPRESPGGWQLIGTTDAVLWNEQTSPPALLAPGTRVRFEAV